MYFLYKNVYLFVQSECINNKFIQFVILPFVKVFTFYVQNINCKKMHC